MKQFEDLMKNPQQAIQRNLEAQQELAEDYNNQQMALGKKLALDIQEAVKSTPYDMQKVAQLYTEYQKNVVEVNTRSAQNTVDFWTNFAKSFAPKA